MSNELTPETRRELYYDAMLGGDDMPADPHTREERYLEAIVEAIEAGSSDEKIQEAVDNYMENNPDAFEEAIAPLIAPEWNEEEVYKVGNLLTYLGKMYEVTGDDGADPPVGTLPTDTDYFTERPVSDIIEMIKNGSIVVGHSDVADNLTPYSEDSGVTQENPFISQGTGTDNNSVIVTTGTIARQLEKQGNTVVKNQQIRNPNFTDTSNWSYYSYTTTLSASNNELTATGTGTGVSVNQTLANKIPSGHKVLVMFDIKSSTSTSGFGIFIGNISDVSHNLTANYQHIAHVYTLTTDATRFEIAKGGSQSAPSITLKNVYIIDLTQWGFSADIITDLTSHPEHFSWYYNGSMSYDAGSLQNCNGRYLECGQGRNLFDQEWELGGIDVSTGQNVSSSTRIGSKGYILVVPNKPIYFYHSSKSARILFYDANKNFLDSTATFTTSKDITIPSNAWYIRFWQEDTTYDHNISVEEYYTPAEGGEGYGEMHDYIAPIRIDTGNEPLLAFDRKLPSGVIGHNTEKIVLDGVTSGRKITSVSVHAGTGLYYGALTIPQTGVQTTSTQKSIVCDKFVNAPTAGSGVCYITSSGNSMIFFNTDQTLTTVEAWNTWLTTHNVTVEYLLAEANRTTEQGTPFSEYAPINDYSYMAWFDNDGNLVSIPQGCKLFYPVDYKGFTDDLVMYTNGDATALAKEEDITDTALNARGYYKMQDLSSEITDVAGLTYTRKVALKTNNIVTLTITCKNETASAISAGSILFDIGTSIRNNSTNAFAIANETGSGVSSKVMYHSWDGHCKLTSQLAVNEVLYINITFAIV